MTEKFKPAPRSVDISIINDVGGGMRTVSNRGVGLAPKKTETLVPPPRRSRLPKSNKK